MNKDNFYLIIFYMDVDKLGKVDELDDSNHRKLEGQKRRGKIHEKDLESFINLSSKELISLLNNNNPQKRTIAAKLLGDKNDSNNIKPLINQFAIEKALYSRIAISESLVNYKEKVTPHLIELLGKIGNNQEKELPTKYFNKKSFPLPRDLTGRTLVKIGKIATPYLIKVLESEGKIHGNFVKEQAIDTIGAIAYKYDDHSSLDSLINLSRKHDKNKIIQWKIIRALSGFKNNKHALNLAINILNKYYHTKMNKYAENTIEIQWEAIKSIGQIGIPNKEVNEILNSFEGNENPQIQFALKIARKSLY
jgi:HEAT repeat protein